MSTFNQVSNDPLKPVSRTIVPATARMVREFGPIDRAASLSPVEAMTIQEFARRYSICRASAHIEIREGRLTACKMGGKAVILREDAERWAANLPRIKPAPRTLEAEGA